MTTDTRRRGGAVVEGRHRPICGGVTGLAGLGGLYVCCAHTGRDYPIMAGCTGTDDLVVIHRNGRHPATGGRMAGVALVTTVDVRTGLIRLTGGDHPVVTTLAGTLGFIVIYGRDEHPERIDVTGFAQITGENMCRRLTGGGNPIVTAYAGRRNVAVVKTANRPVLNDVTNITGQGSG